MSINYCVIYEFHFYFFTPISNVLKTAGQLNVYLIGEFCNTRPITLQLRCFTVGHKKLIADFLVPFQTSFLSTLSQSENTAFDHLYIFLFYSIHFYFTLEF